MPKATDTPTGSPGRFVRDAGRPELLAQLDRAQNALAAERATREELMRLLEQQRRTVDSLGVQLRHARSEVREAKDELKRERRRKLPRFR